MDVLPKKMSILDDSLKDKWGWLYCPSARLCSLYQVINWVQDTRYMIVMLYQQLHQKADKYLLKVQSMRVLKTLTLLKLQGYGREEKKIVMMLGVVLDKNDW